ncbi:MAG: TetR/AcrR family transcriptional regulator [Proteobacteria bacterium]|nr:TetR/AcrR family transcriptional regulator [Pseudomonadota bacterium]
MPRQSDKRQRLIEAGKEVIYRQGYSRTTLANIAETAGVPLGNVYYHFKTKELLARAVIQSRMDDLRRRVELSDANPDPGERLVEFIMFSLDRSKQVAAHGCPYGSLAQELDKAEKETPLGRSAAELLQIQLDWMTEQFHAMGRESDAEQLAADLLARLQGYCLLANSLDDPAVMEHGFHRVAAWIRSQSPR